MEIKKMLDIIDFVKKSHIKYDTALTVTKQNNIRDAK
jgi:hypothetical protein